MATSNAGDKERFSRYLRAAINSIAELVGPNIPAAEKLLGDSCGVAATTISRYKSDHIKTLPNPEIVFLLAKCGAEYGHLDQVWARGFLEAASYPTIDEAMAELFPNQREPQLIFEESTIPFTNLPRRRYSRFVMRPAPYARALEGLQTTQTPVIALYGFPGIGKTSLCHEIAWRLFTHDEKPEFDAIIWTSDKLEPNSTSLESVLRTIAATLEHQALATQSGNELRRGVERLLRRIRTLLIVDNIDSITDKTLIRFLQDIPERSRAIVTTRDLTPRAMQALGDNIWPVPVDAMDVQETREMVGNLIAKKNLNRTRRDELLGAPDVIQFIHETTYGNPQAIDLVIGMLKEDYRSVYQALRPFQLSREQFIENFLEDSWARLTTPDKRILMAVTLFPKNANGDADREALACASGYVNEPDGDASDVVLESNVFIKAVEKLQGLSLIQELVSEGSKRYSLHQLVHAFVSEQLRKNPGFEQEARRRWVDWYAKLANSKRWPWQHLQQFNRLAPEEDSFIFVLDWAEKHNLARDVLNIALGVDHYFYVRGLWHQKLTVDGYRIRAAQNLGDTVAEIEALTQHIQLLCHQGRPEALQEATNKFVKLESLASTAQLPIFIQIEIAHARVFYAIARREYGVALEILETTQQLIESATEPQTITHLGIANLHWMGICQYKCEMRADARETLLRAYDEATTHTYERSIIVTQIYLAQIDIDEGRFHGVESRLKESFRLAEAYHEVRLAALAHFVFARFHTHRGSFSLAREEFRAAIDRFTRLGMSEEVKDAEIELARLQ